MTDNHLPTPRGTTSLRLDEELHAMLARLAEATHLSKHASMILALTEACERRGIKPKKKKK